MAQWDGKSRGAVLGYKIFIFLIKYLGVRSAYFLLYFVALYFLLFSFYGTKASFYYFHKRLGFGKLISIGKVYKSYFVFGQTIIDKVTISSGIKNKFTYEHDGGDAIVQLLKEKKGGILISAHIGNFEIADYFFNEMEDSSQINLVTTDREHRAIKEYLESISLKNNLKYIIVYKDLSHIFEINNALNNNELVCFTGDRYLESNKVLTENLFGKKAKFPAGTFLLGSRLNVPVLFVYVMKETSNHYHLYTRKANFKKRDAQDLLRSYTQSVEWILKKYPYQWFNYFDFWNDIK
ncbi:MAG: lipid A biosynthesis acyltransferase [Flavobacteriaceae bacterium]|nr:lipid A biosynthesis acyltransferase [Flavobacteriaceae bacterium]